jgi:serine/threonine-protein kinase
VARAGRRAEAEAILAEIQEMARDRYVSPVTFAIVHIGLGNVQEALDWTERAHAERRGWLAYLKVNPIFDPLREEPRFKALVQKMRL